MITHIVSDWLFSPCCVEHQDEFIFERVAVAYSRDYNEVGRAQIKHTCREVLLIVTLIGPIRVTNDNSPARVNLKIDLKTLRHKFCNLP